jgi:hypothetical protein
MNKMNAGALKNGNSTWQRLRYQASEAEARRAQL